MREIKFRAWSDEYKIFSKPFNPQKDFFIEFEYWIKNADEEDILRMEIQRQDIKWHQYVGLKDAQGREVYEGDIFCYTDEVIQEYIGGYPRTLPEGIIGQIRFDKGVYWFNDELAEEVAPYAEIIGNIFENPDLLSTSQK